MPITLSPPPSHLLTHHSIASKTAQLDKKPTQPTTTTSTPLLPITTLTTLPTQQTPDTAPPTRHTSTPPTTPTARVHPTTPAHGRGTSRPLTPLPLPLAPRPTLPLPRHSTQQPVSMHLIIRLILPPALLAPATITAAAMPIPLVQSLLRPPRLRTLLALASDPRAVGVVGAVGGALRQGAAAG